MLKGEPCYAVWVGGDDNKRYYFYDSLEDAVLNHGDPCEVWFMEPDFLGTYESKTTIVKIKGKK